MRAHLRGVTVVTVTCLWLCAFASRSGCCVVLQPALPSLASRTRIFASDQALYDYIKDPGYNREEGKPQVCQ